MFSATTYNTTPFIYVILQNTNVFSDYLNFDYVKKLCELKTEETLIYDLRV